MARSVGRKKSVKHQTGRIVVRSFRIHEDVWNIATGVAIATKQSVGQFLEPLIKNAYLEWLNLEAKRLHL